MYSQQEINEFQQKDRRIIFQSIFSSLTNYYGLIRIARTPELMAEEALKVVDILLKKYPMTEPKQVIIKEEPF